MISNPKPFSLGPPAHVYIHWPFCKNKCHYCDFVALEKHDDYQREYLKALIKEVEDFYSAFATKGTIKTLYIGGGTPSLCPLDCMQELIATIKKYNEFEPAAELTLEVNPGGITHEHMRVWQGCGFNRMSTGVQVLDNDVLAALNRHQKNAEVFELIEMAPDYFDNISIDLIMGLPGVTQEIWQRTLDTVVQWPVQHMSVYFLTVHDKTPLYFNVRRGNVRLKTDDELVDLYEHLGTFLPEHGFEQYETSNYARSGYKSCHNQAYWDRKAYKGFGLGAASFDGQYRMRNERNLTKYCQYWHEDKVLNNARSGPKIERIDKKQEFLERIMLGLRQKRGLCLQDVIDFLPSLTRRKAFVQKVILLQSRNLLARDGDTIYLTRRGMALENEVIVQLI